MDENILYRVVFNGQITEEYDLETTQRKFSKLFGLDPKKTQRIFSGKDYILKSKVTEQDATSFAMKLLEIGCECYVEIMPLVDDISQQPGFVERRKLIRRHFYRRDPRPNVIQPDRRMSPSRRKMDLILLKKEGDFPGNTVKKRTQSGNS